MSVARYRPSSAGSKPSTSLFGYVRLLFSKQNVLYCGNPACKQAIAFEIGTQRPTKCQACGSSIEWLGLYTSLSKVCPICNTRCSCEDYCFYHEAPTKPVFIEEDNWLSCL